MPIYQMLRTSTFNPEQVKMLGDCYETCLKELGLVSRTDPVTLIVAERVMRFAQAGERDPDRLRERVLQSLAKQADTH